MKKASKKKVITKHRVVVKHTVNKVAVKKAPLREAPILTYESGYVTGFNKGFAVGLEQNDNIKGMLHEARMKAGVMPV